MTFVLGAGEALSWVTSVCAGNVRVCRRACAALELVDDEPLTTALHRGIDGLFPLFVKGRQRRLASVSPLSRPSALPPPLPRASQHQARQSLDRMVEELGAGSEATGAQLSTFQDMQEIRQIHQVVRNTCGVISSA